MEENVALDSGKQKKFVKSIRGIKKLIKKNEKIAESEPKKKEDVSKTEKPFSMRLKNGKIKKKRKERGLVYLSHIPHGFYEHQMTQYFKQFGVVTNARVIRSKRTGNSKGFAFVEFKEPSVAQIVAETMNNYLMGKRLIKAVNIEPSKQRRKAFRKHWNTVHNPASIKRLKLKKAFNAEKDDAQELQKAKKMLSKLNKTKKKLSELGINYDFFTPVDVPEALLSKVIKKEKDEEDVKDENEKKAKKGAIFETEQKKAEKVELKANNKNQKKKKEEQKVVKKVDEKGNNNTKIQKTNEVNNTTKKELKKEVANKENKKGQNKSVKVNQKEQNKKEQNLVKAGVKSVEEFISLEGDDSEGSYEFDSDEFEKMIGEDDDFSSSDGSADEESDEDEEEDNDVQIPDSDKEEVTSHGKGKKQGKNKLLPKVTQPAQMKKQTQKEQNHKAQVKKQELKSINTVKRIAPQKPAAAAKKPKFEKQNQKPMKKQFKKKK
ncbi:unnamed protein product [Arctia plantaginis]|uniref:RRM domain-containing protein n=1 Tax=Arctia plantaginis TaxID=874455 RepID=A0A8S0ZZZ8_ARCPL|nr:unnamed protein product [Arctia plantaginis]